MPCEILNLVVNLFLDQRSRWWDYWKSSYAS